MLYAGKDHWGPQFHVDELRQLLPQLVVVPTGGLQGSTSTPVSTVATHPPPDYGLYLSYRPDLRHDYVSYTHMKEMVADWCYQQVMEEFHRVPSPNETHVPPIMTPPSGTSSGRRHSKL